MAKRKTPKTVDLKPRAEKITDQQLERMQKAVSGINRTKIELGSIEMQKHNILHTANELQSLLQGLQEEFQKDYGTTNVNIQDGSIKYEEDGEANKKLNSLFILRKIKTLFLGKTSIKIWQFQ